MKKIFIYLLLLVFLSGCWDVSESERMLYLHGIGVDYKDGEFHVYFQVISFMNVAKKDEGIDQELMQAEVGFAKGKTINEAITNLYKATDEILFWGHLTVIIITDDMITNGNLNILLNSFTRHHDTRYNTWVYVTDKPLKDFFIETPILRKAISLTKMANPINSFEKQSFIEPVNVRKLLIKLNEPNHVVTLPYIEIKDDVWTTEKGPDPAISMDSVAVLTPTEFRGFIKGKNAKGFQWMTKETKKSYITTNIGEDDQDAEDYITMTITNHSVKVNPVIKGDDVRFDIDISVSANLDSFNKKISQEQIDEAVVKTIKEDIKRTFKKGLELECDVFRLSEQLYRKNVKLWKKLEKEGSLPLNEDSIRNINIYVDKVDTGRKKYSRSVVSP